MRQLKLSSSSVHDLPIRPIVSSMRTATCQTLKYLAKLLSPLVTSEYTISNTKTFVKQIRRENFLSDMKWLHLV